MTARRGTPSRLWARAALRRPGRGLLVVAGLLAMSVATVASLVAADSLERLFVADARAQWGAVDVVTLRPGDAFIDHSTAIQAAVDGPGPEAPWASRLILDAVAAAPGTSDREPQARVIGVNAEERQLTDPMTGRGTVDPLELGPEEVLLSRRLAGRIDARVGDRVQLVIAVPERVERQPNALDRTFDPRVVRWQPTVAGIAADEGVADFGRTPNVVTRLDTLQRVTELPGKITGLYVSAPAAGADAAEEVVEQFESVNRQLGLVAIEAKEAALDIARDEGGLFRGILLTLALLVVAASAVVTVNLIVLLGQARAREVALLRVLGARQRDVRWLFVLEAGLYAVVAAVVGTAIAVPLGDLLAGAIAEHFAGISAGRGREQVELALTARPGTVAAGVLAVLLVSLGTVRAAARRVAGISTDEVLRGGPPLLPGLTSSDRRTRWTRAGGLLVLGMGITAADAGDLLTFTGLSLLLASAWLTRRHGFAAGPAPGVRRRRLDERAALLGLLWCLAAPALLGDFSRGVQSSFGLLTLAGIGAVTCATVPVSRRMPVIMRALRVQLPHRRIQAALRTAGAHASAIPSRAGMVVGTVGIVLFMVAALAVLGSATDIGTARQSGGYDVIGTAPVAVDTGELRAARGLAHLDALEHVDMDESQMVTRDDDGATASVPYPLRAIRLGSPFVAAQRFRLVDALPEYDTAEAALEAAATGHGVVIDRYARPEGAQPGDDVVVDDGGGPSSHELLAVLDTFVLQGVLFGPDDYGELFATRGPTLVLGAGREGVEPATLAADLAATGAERGLAVTPVAEAAAEVVRINRTFTDIFAVMLGLGLAVALVAVAVLAARAARERRAQLAVLRTIGFTRREVAVTLLAEPLLQTATGIVIGVGVGLGVLWLLFRRGFADLAFVVGWSRLGLTTAAVLGLVVVSCLIPAIRGARRDVGTGLRDLG